MIYYFDVAVDNDNRARATLTDPCLVGEHLIFECQPVGESKAKYHIQLISRRTNHVSGDVVASGLDAVGSPLGRPVSWRIEQRGARQFYCSSFWMAAEEISAICAECEEISQVYAALDLPWEGGPTPVTIETLLHHESAVTSAGELVLLRLIEPALMRSVGRC
jgi:hypothetical protein